MKKKMTKKWRRPALTVLFRPEGLQERVLTGCKVPYKVVLSPDSSWNKCFRTYCNDCFSAFSS